MKLSREKLEQHQIWLYSFSLLFGGVLGISNTDLGASLDWAISPLIAILLYGMFTQIPFLKLREAVSNFSFMGALLIGNFIAVPAIVWVLIILFPQSPPILLGLCLVLLTPCIDYVIVFTQLGKGDEKLMLASTPILFVVQMLLLPLYLWFFIGQEMLAVVHIKPFLEAFLLLIVMPLILAVLTQLWSKKKALGKKIMCITGWLPVPFMALVLMVVVASQISKIYNDFAVIVRVIPIYVLFLIITPFVSRFIASVFKLGFNYEVQF